MGEITVADAPGRVNLIGEHTDYNEGWVLPTPIPGRCRIALRRTGGRDVRFASENVRGEARWRLGEETRSGDWADYARAVTWALREAGHALEGFEAEASSDVPLGAGLSSSAALEVALLRALRAAFGLGLDDLAVALLAKRAENEFVGDPAAVADPLAASLGVDGQALLVDARACALRPIPFPPEVELVLLDSGIVRPTNGGTGTRRDECARAARALGVASLRDLRHEDLRRLDALPPPLDRRARHVVTENERVLKAAAFLGAGDLESFGDCLVRSHASLRDDFEVSLPEIDALVDTANDLDAIYGARLTGEGFGGCVLAVARAGAGEDAARAILDAVVAPAARLAFAWTPALERVV